MLNRKRDGMLLVLSSSFFSSLTLEKEQGVQLEKCYNIFFTRCGLSSTYHLVPLTLLQYDTKLTRQCDSIMLIHDWLDTGVIRFHPSTTKSILHAFRLLRARLCLLWTGIIGSSPLSQSIDLRQYNKDETSFLNVPYLRSAQVKVLETQTISNSLPWSSFWNTLPALATSEASV